LSRPLHPREVAVRNPRSGVADYAFTQLGAEGLAAECRRLREGQRGWAAAAPDTRAAALLALAEEVKANRAALIEALVADTGRVRESGLEVDATAAAMARWAGMAAELLAEAGATATQLPGIRVARQRVPMPLAGIISPWNFPLLLALIDAVPALLAGCAVLVKPSEVTPRFIEPFMRCVSAVPALAPVLSVQPGEGDLGAALIEQVDCLCFTGSVATGQRVAEAAAARFIPANLELGGKDPAIVCADADLERAAAAICWGGMVNAGQSCLSIERVYVEAPACADFTEALVEKARSLRLNHPDPAAGEIGPVIAAPQADVIRRHLADARERGAEIRCGGEVVERDGGLWCLPTIIAGASADMRVVAEETFAPVLPVLAFSDDEDALRQANDSRYGLSAAVFSGDRARAEAIARRLEAGAISINDAALTSLMHEGEKQAFKHSGLGGSRMGPGSIRRFLKPKALIENTDCRWDPWWFHHPGR